eukprot:407583-Prymnesium_polylepis.1
MEAGGLHAADSSAASQLHPSQSAWRQAAPRPSRGHGLTLENGVRCVPSTGTCRPANSLWTMPHERGAARRGVFLHYVVE